MQFFVTDSVDIKETLLSKGVSGGIQGLNINKRLKERMVQLFPLKIKKKQNTQL